MSIEELWEVAEAELDAGVPDPELAARALMEANGIRAKARQIYWYRRAERLREQALASPRPDAFLRAVRDAAASKRRALERRRALRDWLYTFAIYGAFSVAFMFGCAAYPAYLRQSSAAWTYSLSATGFAALGLVALVRSKREMEIDPFTP